MNFKEQLNETIKETSELVEMLEAYGKEDDLIKVQKILNSLYKAKEEYTAMVEQIIDYLRGQT